MRLGASSADLAHTASWDARVSSTRAGVLLANDVPVLSGRVVSSTGQQVPDRLTITVPRFSVEDDRTRDWLPVTDDAALARYGQQLDLTIVAAGVDTRMGRFLIKSWDYDEATITVNAVGLLQFAADDRLPLATSPRDNATLKSEFQRLLPEQMSVQFDPALVNRACPKAMEWSEEKIAALYDIADAWPARLRVDSWGQVLLKPTLPAYQTPILSFRDGEGGTVVAAPRAETRDQGFNHVVVRSSADGVDAWGEAEQTSGPMAVATYGRVTKKFASPVVLTAAQCLATAQAMRDESVRQSVVIRVTALPDPRLEVDDPVEVVRDGIRQWGYVIGVDMPVTATDGPMYFDVGVF